mgnify:CR=1 FL=1
MSGFRLLLSKGEFFMAKIDWGEKLELKIRMLPESPGCYLMKDKDGTIIYVGKAVNLKNRVRSYFRDTEHTPKVAAMISHIDDFDILLCDSNLEALCLECNLIKLHKPYYNILLKDDKHYPYLRVNLKEPFPRLTLARRMEKDGAKYFGPYIGATAVRQVIDAVRGVFPLRTCRKELPLKTPCRPCVNYEIGKCLAPCAGKCTEEQYWDMMDGVLAFLGGDYKQVLDVLNREMMDYAAKMQYERAAVIRDKIRDVQGLMERQIAIQTDRSEQDILAIAQDGLDAMIQLVYVRGGRMVGGDHFALPREGSEPAGDVLAEFLTQYYQEGNLIPRNILVQELPDGAQAQLEQWLRQQKGAAVTLVTPRRGEKHDLVLLAAKNAHDALEKRNARASIREERTVGAAAALGPGNTGDGKGQLHVGQHGLVGDEVVALEHKADGVVAVGVPVAVGVLPGGDAVDDKVAAVVAVQAADDVQQRRLAGAARAEDGDKFVVAQVQADIVQRFLDKVARAVFFSDVVELKHVPCLSGCFSAKAPFVVPIIKQTFLAV